MCSWCYGFARELDEARGQLPGFDLDIQLAGIWAGGRDVLDDAAKQFRLDHWVRVEAASGAVFNRQAFLARQGFVYDTGPISRAFIAGKQCLPGIDQLRLFRALQQAFYEGGLDTTSGSVLAGVLQRALADQGLKLDAETIRHTLDSAEVADAALAEFERVRSWGLRSFPQLLCVEGEQITVLHSGFAKARDIVARVRHMEARSCPV